MAQKIRLVKDFFVGIDYGTTKSAIATVERGGAPELLNIDPNYSGSSIPSAVKLSLPEGDLSSPKFNVNAIGYWAKYAGDDIDDSSQVFEQAKLQIGKGTFKHQYPIKKSFESVTPEDIAANIIRYLKQAAEKNPMMDGNTNLAQLQSATITVPANWDPVRREATKYSAMLAGFDDIELIDEPVAALLHVWKNKKVQLGLGQTDEKIMVIDMGGGTCDIAVVQLRSRNLLQFWTRENVKIILSQGNNRLGGELINQMIEDEFQFDDSFGFDHLSIGERKKRIESLKLRINETMSRQAMKHLETISQRERNFLRDWKAFLPKEFEGVEYLGGTKWELSANKLHSILSETLRLEIGRGSQGRSFIQAFIDLINSVLNNCGGAESFQRVILVGGSSYLYFVIPILYSIFKDLEWGKTLYRPDWPEKCIALGAASHEIDRYFRRRSFEPRFFYDVDISTSAQPIKLIKADTKLPIPFRSATSIPFNVSEEANELVIKMHGMGSESNLDDLNIFKTLMPLRGKIIPNSDMFLASAHVSVDGIVSLRVVEKDHRITLVPLEKYSPPLSELPKLREEFRKKYVEINQ